MLKKTTNRKLIDNGQLKDFDHKEVKLKYTIHLRHLLWGKFYPKNFISLYMSNFDKWFATTDVYCRYIY